MPARLPAATVVVARVTRPLLAKMALPEAAVSLLSGKIEDPREYVVDIGDRTETARHAPDLDIWGHQAAAAAVSEHHLRCLPGIMHCFSTRSLPEGCKGGDK